MSDDANTKQKRGKGERMKRNRDVTVMCLLLDYFQENNPRGVSREMLEADLNGSMLQNKPHPLK